jgi:ribosomal protein L37AE/L43A
MDADEETGGGGPRCPICSSEDVAIRGSQNIRTAPPLQAWECKKCGAVFAGVGFTFVPPTEPELRLFHGWLNYNAPPIIRAMELEPTFGGA